MSVEFDDFKERVREQADIVDVVSSYVTLKKRGGNYWGCCPFHGEKTPSFAVNPQKRMFYCFGCHVGGDVFKFIMKIENCTFPDALKNLAGKYGIPIPEKKKSAAEIQREQKAKIVAETNALAVKFFQACLLRTEYGKNALAYLNGRGITAEIIESFSIGFALNNFSALLTSLGKRGFSQEMLLQAGLAVAGKNGGVYDKFRNRIMIPIKDGRGRVVGFGGRVIGDGQPKYMNTGETEWFNKRYILFGLDIALKSIRSMGYVIVVEGYMDAISLHAAGITNAVASMGTAFSQEQAKLLKRAAETIVFCYDSDNAGRRASVRAVSIARNAGLKVKVAKVPDGKDPDEFVRRHGREEFLAVINNAPDGMDFQMEETILQNNVTNLAGKVDAVSNILPFLLECKNEIEAAGYIRKLAQRLTIDEGLISDEYRKVLQQNTGRASVPVRKIPDAINKSASITEQAEGMLLALLIKYPSLAKELGNTVNDIGFISETRKNIFTCILQLEADGKCTEPTLMERLDGQSSSMLAGILTKYVPDGNAEVIAEDCLRQMRKNKLEREYERRCMLADEYERAGDKRFLDELTESQIIKNEIKKLFGN